MMLRFLLIILAILACGHPASAKSLAIRCIDDSEMAYFVTFDVDTGKVVFKSAGGNFLEGHVTSSEPGRIAFTLSYVPPPDLDLVWDESSMSLTWIGAPNNKERRTVISLCTIIPPLNK
jgi:hypothetical protein